MVLGDTLHSLFLLLALQVGFSQVESRFWWELERIDCIGV